jgi:hypothetical protein
VSQRRALRVFRDTTNLEANLDLGAKITEALDTSRYLIVVLSPHAAASRWVNKEVSYRLEHRVCDHLMLVLAEGHLQWDEAQARFDQDRSDAAVPVLTESRALPAEPLYIDVSKDTPWDLGSLTFRDKVTALAAPIHGKPKDELSSDDQRAQPAREQVSPRAMPTTGRDTIQGCEATPSSNSCGASRGHSEVPWRPRSRGRWRCSA